MTTTVTSPVSVCIIDAVRSVATATPPAASGSDASEFAVALYILAMLGIAMLTALGLLIALRRARSRHDGLERHRKTPERPDAWEEAGRRLETPPADPPEAIDDHPDKPAPEGRS